MSDLAEMIRRNVVLPDRREIWEWAAENIDFGGAEAFKGPYDVTNVPQTREFLRACRSPHVREVTFIAPPQESGKTKAAEVAMCHRIATRPAKMAFNLPTNTKASAWSETRWDAMLAACPTLRDRFSSNKNKKKTTRIIFKDGTFLLIQGAEVAGNRASDSIEFQVNDEVRLWDRPWVKEMHDRTLAYRATRKIVNISVGGKKGSELHERYLAGNQGEWCHHCPACSKPFAYVFNTKDPLCNIRFDMNAAIIHADGRLDLREFSKTVKVVCPACRHEMAYDAERLAAMNRRGVYVDRNPDADPSIVSLHCNAFALGKTPWSEILEPWVRLHIRGGVFAPEIMEEFICQKLAEFWDERPFVVSTEIKTMNFTRADVIKPKSWKDEVFRVMAIDNQRGSAGDIPHRWFACVAFAGDGRMRLIDAGRIDDWEEVKAKQVSLGVPDPTEIAPGPWTVCDRRYDPVDVDEVCSRYKWYGMLGAPQDEFLHPPHSQFAGTRQLFTEPRAIDIGFGTAEMGRRHSWYLLWSSQRIQDLFAQIRGTGRLEIPRDVGEWCPELAEHLNSHRQIMEPTRTGGEKRTWKKIGGTPDHLYDCLCEAVVVGSIAGVYQKEQTEPPPPPP
jgi:hypothetical protein